MSTFFLRTTPGALFRRHRFLRVPIAFLVILALGAFFQRAQAQCTGCTQTVTTNTNIEFTANNQVICLNPATTFTFNANVNFYSYTGVTLCVGPNVTWNGGGFTIWSPTFTIINHGTISRDLPDLGTNRNFHNNSGATFTGSATLNGGTITNSGTFNPTSYSHNSGTLTLNSGGSATMPGFSVSNGSMVNNGSLTINGGLTINSSGSATLGGTTTITGSLTNNKTLTVTGNLSVGGDLTTNSSAITSLSGATTVGGNVTNNGTFAAASLDVTGSFTNNGGSTATLNGPTSIGLNVTNNGTVNLNGPLDANGSITNNGSGTFNGSGASSGCSSLCSNGTITNYGTLASISVCKSMTGNNSGATLGGTLNSPAAVCGGTNSGTLTLTGHNGTIVRWEMSVNSDFSSPTTINNTTTSLSFSRTVTTYYRAVISGGSCGLVYSSVSTVAVNGAPTITSQPVSTNVCTNGTATFTVGATGSTVFTYQWQIASTFLGMITGWNNLNDGGVYSGTKSETLAITNPGTGLSGNYYRVRVTSCGNTDNSNIVTLTVNSQPTVYNVGGGGAYCDGASGVSVTLSGSQSGLSYQLYVDGVATGASRSGTGGTLTWTNQTTAGTYTVIATNGDCDRTMNNSATVSVNPSPTLFDMTSTGTNCAGVNTTYGLSGSESGVSYQLRRGTTNVGTAVNGTGNAISFAAQNTAGTYTVLATRGTCTSTMNGSFVIATQPTLYTVSGGGSYCAGGSGVTITLSGSQNNTYRYQLYVDGVASGTARTGTSGALSWTNQTVAGTYTVVASIGDCDRVMTGSATVSINAVPTLFDMTSTGTNCAGVNTTYGLSDSESGVSYQLRRGTTNVGTAVNGTGNAISFAAQNTAGTYTVLATRGTCTNTMNGSFIIATQPTVYNVGGGGSYCAGGSGVSVTLSNSQSGLSYQLYVDGVATGASRSGTGGTLTWTNQTTVGTYTVIATNGDCDRTMNNSATVSVNPPSVGGSIAGSTSVCSGSNSGTLTLSGHTGSVIRWESSTSSTFAGVTTISNTTTSLSYSNLTTTTYYRAVVQNNPCSATYSATATITVNALPALYTVTGGGTYCTGGSGLAVGLSGSQSGVNYQLKRGAVNVGSTVSGTGSAISFGNQTVAGTYTVVATHATTSCSQTMTGSVAVAANGAPTITASPANRSACAGTTASVTFTVGASTTSGTLTYQWQVLNGTIWTDLSNAAPYSNVTTATMTITSPNTALNTKQYRAVVSVTGCNSVASNAAFLAVSSPPVITSQPAANTVCSGSNATFTVLATGSSPLTYQWQIGNSSTGPWTNLSNGSAYSGVGTATLTVLNPTTALSGKYYQVVINGCSSATSGSALLTVNTPPSISAQTTSRSICSGANTTFAVTASGGTLSYQWQESQDNGATWLALSNDGTYSTVTTATLNITGASSALHGRQYRVAITASGNVCTVYSTGAPLTINSLVSSPLTASVCSGTPFNYTITSGASNATFRWSRAAVTGISNAAVTNVNSATIGETLVNTTSTPKDVTYVLTVTSTGNTCSPTTANLIVTVMPSNTIKTLTVSPAVLCAGSTVSVGFVAPCGFNSDNEFTAQLSDATGSFSTPINIGTITGTASGTIAATIPSGTVAAGTKYRIRVVSSSPVLTGTDNGSDLTIQMYSITPLISQSITTTESGTTLTATSAGVTNYQWGYYTELGGAITNLPSTSTTYQPKGSDFPNPGTYYVVCTMATSSAGCAVAVSNAVTVYVNCPLTANLVYNGDFSITPDSPVGSTTSTVTPPTNLGFTSEYFYANTSNSLSNNLDGTGTPGGEGKYGITTNPNFLHYAFCNVGSSFQPSPESGGNMLVGNAATSGSQNLWKQTIAVKTNTDYVLTFWAASLAGEANSLQFGIYAGCFRTGADISVAQIGVSNCGWTKFTVQLSSGTMTSVDLAIRNISAAAGGNDIAIDDITLYECQPSNGNFGSATTFVWRGFSTDWFNMDNWGTACVLPSCDDDIVIPMLTSDKFYPVINAAGAKAGTITINSGATLKINAGLNLDVCGNFTNNNGTLSASSTSTVTFMGSKSPQIVSGSLTGANQMGHLIVNKTNNADVLQLDKPLSIAGNLTITRGNLNANGQALTIGGTMSTAATGTFTSSANTTRVTGSLSNAGTFVAGSGTTQVTGNFTNGGNFTAGTGTLRITGNMTNSGTFTPNTGTVELNGTTDQSFSQTGTGSFYNLVINNSLASSKLTFNPAATTISNQLTLTRGVVTTTGSNEIRVTNTAGTAVTGHSANSYVNGVLRRWVTGLNTYDFPVGDATRYELARMQITSSLGITNVAGFFRGNTPSNGTGLLNLDGQGNDMSICTGGYWDLTPNASVLGSARYNLTLFPVGFSCAGISQTFIKRSSSSAGWTYDGSTYLDATTRTGIRGFSEYTFASSNVSLPVKLTHFAGKLKEEGVELNWTTTMEKNNDYFEVERSSDAINFHPIGRVKGAGTTMEQMRYVFKDEHPFSGMSYYRLKQVDWDGLYEYSKAIAIENTLSGSVVELYPNPIGRGSTATLRIRSTSNQNYLVSIMDIRGREIATYPLPVYKGENEFILNEHRSLAAGIYIIQLSPQGSVNGKGSWQMKLVVQ